MVQDVVGSSPISHPKLEGVRMDEDTALKAAGCERLGGSIPSSSAKNKNMKKKDDFYWIKSIEYVNTQKKNKT